MVSVALCLFGIAVAWLGVLIGGLVYLLAALRFPEIIVRTTTVNFSDVISTQRSLILVAINYAELMLWFGLVYSFNIPFLHGAVQPATAFYFSVHHARQVGCGS